MYWTKLCVELSSPANHRYGRIRLLGQDQLLHFMLLICVGDQLLWKLLGLLDVQVERQLNKVEIQHLAKSELMDVVNNYIKLYYHI